MSILNIGGIGGGVLDNRGLITTRADPRNGTVYGDVTADNQSHCLQRQRCLCARLRPFLAVR
ncbi:MAG: hypothetical protein ACFBSG_11135 [Leptolyngbyaceae cyanobacterium]